MKSFFKILMMIPICVLGLFTNAIACTAPAPITGNNNPICAGQTTDTLFDATGGGTWSSGNTGVAVIGSLSGVVSGVAAGTAVIYYTTGTGCFATVTVTVNPLPDPILGATNVCRTYTTTLTDATPGGTWSSDHPTIASVNSSGVVTGVAPSGGTAIRYTLPTGCQAPAPLFMTVHIAPGGLPVYSEFCQGSTQTVNVDYPVGGTWSSSNTAVATVADLGYPFARIAGVSGGTAIISYNIVSCPSNTDTVTIDPLPAPIDGLTSICIGATTSLSDSTAGGTWMSSDTTVADIDPVTGLIRPNTLILGLSTVITYTLPTSCLVTAVVTTNTAPAPIEGVDSVCQGSSLSLVDTSAGGIWSSSSLATVQVIDTSGLVVGVMAGSAAISYTLPSGCYAALPFKVEMPIPATVSITQSPDTMICGGTPVVFAATTTNAGAPTFQWLRFASAITDSTRDSLDYLPVHGDAIICEVVTHGVCSVHDTVYDTIATNVYPYVAAPIVRVTTSDTFGIISDSVNRLLFPGQVITFFANVTYGGTAVTYEWYENGVATGATGPSYRATVYGNDTVYCVVTGNPPCDTSALPHTVVSNRQYVFGAYLGVPDLSVSGQITLFPNPNNGTFTISATNLNAEGIDIYVTDILGQKVYSEHATTTNGGLHETLDLRYLPAGTYLLRSAQTGETLHFVIEK